MNVNELFDIKGKTAVITGGSMGLGATCAEALAQKGVNLVLAARKKERCEKLCVDLEKEYGIQAQAAGCDVSKPEDCENLVNVAIERFGKIDILINNAGATWGADALEYPLDGWKKVVDTNLNGTWVLTQLTARKMKEQGGGKIIMMSSAAGIRASKTQSTPAYNATKAAIIHLAKDLAVKWAKYGICVNSLAPGYFPTHMTAGTLEAAQASAEANIPMGRIGNDDDLKGVVVLLSSPASDYITGQCISIDGGSTL
jgi:NAD(P)-dependent dehydrogenase (short-subunit alcohol dehydrogenase family)